MTHRTVAIICGLFVALFYALNFTIAKEATPIYIGAYGLAWYRVIGTGAIFWIIASLAGPKEHVPLKELPLIALAAFCGVGLNMVTFMKGLSLTSPISASVLMVTTPIIVLVLSFMFLKEKLKPLKILGIVTGFTGAALLILSDTAGQTASATDPFTGNILVFINALSYSFYIILAKKLTGKYHVFTLMKWLYFFGIVFITPFGLQEGLDFSWSTSSPHVLWCIAYVVLFATFGTYMLNIIAIKNLKPSVVAVFIYLQPLIATFVAVGLAKDVLTIHKAIAGLLIFAGVYLTTKTKKKD